MAKEELMNTLRRLLRDVVTARFEGGAYAKLSRCLRAMPTGTWPLCSTQEVSWSKNPCSSSSVGARARG